MLSVLKELVFNNWKTTCAGLTTALVWLAKSLFGIDVPEDVKVAFVGFLATIAVFFAKDGNK